MSDFLVPFIIFVIASIVWFFMWYAFKDYNKKRRNR